MPLTYRKLAVVALGASPYGLDVSPDGARVAQACFDQKLRVYDAATMQELKRVHVGSSFPHGVVFLADQSAIGAGGRALSLFDASAFKRVGALKGHRDEILRAAAPASNTHLVTVSGASYRGADCSLRVWDRQTLAPLTRWKLDAQPYGLDVRHDAGFVAAATSAGEIVGGQLDDAAPRWSHRVDDWFYESRFTPEGDEVWAVGDRGVVTVLDAVTGAPRRSLALEGATRGLAHLPEGRFAYAHKTLVVADRDGAVVWRSEPLAQGVAHVAASRDGQRLFVACFEPASLWVFEREG